MLVAGAAIMPFGLTEPLFVPNSLTSRGMPTGPHETTA